MITISSLQPTTAGNGPETGKRWTLANLLTAGRIVAAPFIMVVLCSEWASRDYLAAGIFILAALTDAIDGKIARKYHEVTRFGQLFDPLADKILLVSTLVPLAYLERLAWWVVLLIISREILITVIRALASHHGGPVAASWLGKAKTATQMVAIPWVILQNSIPGSQYAMAVAILFTLISGIHYLFLWWPYIVKK